MAIGGRLAINRTTQLQGFNNALGGELEVLAHQLFQFLLGDCTGAEGLNQDAHGFCHADSVSKLHLASFSQARGDYVLGDVARHVGCGAVNLCRVLTAEGAAAVASHAAVGIHDDLASGQAGVAHRAAHNETSGRIDVILGIFVEELRGNRSLNHILQNICMQFLVVHVLGVLC